MITRGFTLVEFLFSMLIGSMIILSLFAISIQSSKTLHKSAIACWSQRDANIALEKLSHLVRESYDIRVFSKYETSHSVTNAPGKYLWIHGHSSTAGVYLLNSKLYFVPDVSDDDVPSSADDFLLANNLVETNIFSFDDFNLSVKFDVFSPRETDKILISVDTILHPRNI